GALRGRGGRRALGGRAPRGVDPSAHARNPPARDPTRARRDLARAPGAPSGTRARLAVLGPERGRVRGRAPARPPASGALMGGRDPPGTPRRAGAGRARRPLRAWSPRLAPVGREGPP